MNENIISELESLCKQLRELEQDWRMKESDEGRYRATLIWSKIFEANNALERARYYIIRSNIDWSNKKVAK